MMLSSQPHHSHYLVGLLQFCPYTIFGDGKPKEQVVLELFLFMGQGLCGECGFFGPLATLVWSYDHLRLWQRCRESPGWVPWHNKWVREDVGSVWGALLPSWFGLRTILGPATTVGRAQASIKKISCRDQRKQKGQSCVQCIQPETYPIGRR